MSELERIWKEEILTNQVAILALAWREAAKPRKTGIPAKIQTNHPSNMSTEGYHYGNLLEPPPPNI
jgi:hypothetical protein